MTRSSWAATSVAVILIFCIASVARAAVPASLNYQGYLTDADGAAIEGSTEMIFAIYSDATSGAVLWTSASLVVPVDQGLFSVQLGHVANPFPPTLFDTPLWLGVAVRGEAEMVPRRPLTTVGFAFKADDALNLQGQGPMAFDQSGHVIDTANPHAVTTAQTGAATDADIANLQGQLDAVIASIASLETNVLVAEADIAANTAAINAEIASRTSDVDAEEEARIAADDFLGTAIADIQGNSVLQLDDVLTLTSGDTALFSGVNLQVVNGTGSTAGAPNGIGNIIVGYDVADSGPPICSLGAYDNQIDCQENSGAWASSHKSGSHNVVIGDTHNYSRYGGLVVGLDNNITGDWASVSGGINNSASGISASISGGRLNLADGFYSSISGGQVNIARGVAASISGGHQNLSSGEDSSVSGGLLNTASSDWASISGGLLNTASGELASVTGGESNTASGEWSSVSGGRNNMASGIASSVSGGGSTSAALGNHAYADYSSILGGIFNKAGDPSSGDHAIGSISAIAGGDTNRTTGSHSSVSGGVSNEAAGFRSSVSGGSGNIAFGNNDSVAGGDSVTCASGGTVVMCGEGSFGNAGD